jgi:hypothetical protein
VSLVVYTYQLARIEELEAAVSVEVGVEIAAEVNAEVLVELAAGRLGYHLQIWLIILVV